MKHLLQPLRLLALATILVALFSVAFLSASRAALLPHDQRLLGPVQPPPSKAITLGQAWEIATDYAYQWDKEAILLSLASNDGSSATTEEGREGRRTHWQATFSTPEGGAGRQLDLQVVHGAVIEAIEGPSSGTPAKPLAHPLLDSPAAILVALEEEPTFMPGDGRHRYKGYHFRLEWLTGKPHLSILGQLGDTPARLSFALGVEAEPTLALYRSEARGGVLVSRDTGLTWQASTLQDKMVSRLANDPHDPLAAFAITVEAENLVLYHSHDGGETWQVVGPLPRQAGDWSYDLLALEGEDELGGILVGTPQGLWHSLEGKVWTRVTTLPAGAPQWLAQMAGTGGSTVFVSLTSGAEPGIYASHDLVEWTLEQQGIYRLFAASNRQSVVAIGETPAARPLLFTGEGQQSPLSLPPGTLRVAGQFTARETIVLQSPTTVWHDTLNTGWQESAPTSFFSSLAVAPDWHRLPITLVGGDGGIYRSEDRGGTWQRVLADPTSLMSGTGEIPALLFLGDSHVVAIHGGAWAWQVQ